ncbi:3-hydroxyacyl-CoA dehydrogenase/enoyl-CoA hydratase family protein [Myxococcota bacterium]|nr:3-hydroxyacyl-CoA dehydrogenase/enoyl-CoA hydratase family protein [Myxococcota bacterium]MBU1431183.1 3-hydroxyacyl-CoA dehydrogenase/enoyl-CoA hydratase family protein [Myxococcota bacterium]MBU1899622.1 3-hydroxyacyl-CoA dehydrogenase/enoyl-CoA hydratase family protein [Myxococcota bacterium]
MKGLPIRRAAVLGAGVMGRGIAAHLAGAGVDVLLLDIVPPGETRETKSARDAFAAGGLKAALKNRPPLFYDVADAARIEVGNFDDDLARVAEVDWIIEVVKEDYAIKRALFEKLDALRAPGCLISSNTSGIPLALLTKGRSDDFRRHFLITHFFNPVRYMKLLEVVVGPETDATLVARFERFAREKLGKGVVYAKDAPAFIANRIGTFSLMYTANKMVEGQHSPEMVDAVFGPAMGRAKSAVFRTADVVGLDTLIYVTEGLYKALPNDTMRDSFKTPAFIQALIEQGHLGSKSKKGCYQKVGKAITTFDPYTLAYREQIKPRFESLGAARKIEDTGARIKAIVNADDDAAKFAWDCLAQTLCYSARHADAIAHDLVQVDNGLKWGFNWDLGPFETWDALGVAETTARMKAEGMDVPAWVDEMLAAGRASFYEGPLGRRTYWDFNRGEAVAERVSARTLYLPKSGDDPTLIKDNGGVRLWDIGDGVMCVESRTKMNAVDNHIIEMAHEVLARAGEFEAAVIANHHPAAFSAGANLALVAQAAAEGKWDIIEGVVDGFQKANLALREGDIPVVAAPFGLTLGGGAEICFGADAIQAHAELYMGLVEVGVGLIPAGGGCFSLLHNLQADGPDIDPVVYLKGAFMTIGMGAVSSSAVDARAKGFLKASDRVTMDRDELITAAKWHALGLARSDYRPHRDRQLKVGGRDGYATLRQALWGMVQAGQASAHDFTIGEKLIRVLSGGDVAYGATVSEARFMEMEKEAFMSLCGEAKTQERIAYMLKNNKPLRN